MNDPVSDSKLAAMLNGKASLAACAACENVFSIIDDRIRCPQCGVAAEMLPEAWMQVPVWRTRVKGDVAEVTTLVFTHLMREARDKAVMHRVGAEEFVHYIQSTAVRAAQIAGARFDLPVRIMPSTEITRRTIWCEDSSVPGGYAKRKTDDVPHRGDGTVVVYLFEDEAGRLYSTGSVGALAAGRRAGTIGDS